MMIRHFLFRYAIVGVKTKRGKDENHDKFGIDVYTKFNDEIKNWIKHVEKEEKKASTEIKDPLRARKNVEDSKCSFNNFIH